MKLLLDTSILYSALVHRKTIGKILDLLIEKHRIVLTDYIVEEMKRNINKKVSIGRKETILENWRTFVSLCEVKYKEEYLEFIGFAKELISGKDAPILACAMLPDIDCLVTSDKEFLRIDAPEVNILSAKDAVKQLI